MNVGKHPHMHNERQLDGASYECAAQSPLSHLQRELPAALLGLQVHLAHACWRNLCGHLTGVVRVVHDAVAVMVVVDRLCLRLVFWRSHAWDELPAVHHWYDFACRPEADCATHEGHDLVHRAFAWRRQKKYCTSQKL